VPIVLPGVTDECFLTRLGRQTYGYTPMRPSPDMDFISSIHSADERLPVVALEFGM
jgi:acetylornithine deacetylase/succinyl-diaminopimelate desuccinylase-like protein